MFVLKRRKVSVSSLALSPDGDTLVAGCHRGFLQVWDVRRKAFLREVAAGGHSHRNVCFTGPAEVVTEAGWRLNAYDLTTGVGRRATAENHYHVFSSAASPNPATRICFGQWSDGAVRCVSLPGGADLWRTALPTPGDVTTAVGFSGDGLLAAAGTRQGDVLLLDAATGERRGRIETGREVGVVAPSSDGRRLVWCAGPHLHLWRLSPEPGEVGHHRLGRTHFQAAAWHPSGGFFATVNSDGAVDTWDAATGVRRESFDWGVGKLNDVLFDATGDRAFCASQGGEVVVWDVDN